MSGRICSAWQDWYAAEAAKNEENGQNGQLKNVLGLLKYAF